MRTQPLDEFLVLVELLESLYIHAGDTISLGLVAVRGIPQHTHLELGPRNVAKPTAEHNKRAYVSQEKTSFYVKFVLGVSKLDIFLYELKLFIVNRLRVLSLL